jgi:glutamyl-tRNA reductase
LYLYDIDDLGSVAADNAEERRREAVRAEAIVVEQEQRFRGWLAGLQAVPTIRALRVRLEEIRSQEVKRALGRLGLESAQAEGVEALTRSLVNKILHAPLSRLREEAERGEGMTRLEAARALFDLGDAEAAKAGGSEVPPEDAGGRGGAK